MLLLSFLLCEREGLSIEPSVIVISLVGCEDQPCNWVCREGRDREQEKDDLLVESADKNCMLHFNIL
jgi:hypothetical protein